MILVDPSRPVRVAVQFGQQQSSFQTLRDAVRRAEDMGIDVVYNWDHFFPLHGDPEGRHFESWMTLAAWAEQTERIRLGPLVSANPFRNPNLVADMARTIDQISGGRFILGIGAGYVAHEFDEYGFPFATMPERLRDLEAAVGVIKDRWTRLNPAPTRIPILISGGGERLTMRIAARYADIYHYFGTPEAMARKIDVLAMRCAEVGRNVSDIELCAGLARGNVAGSHRRADEYYDLGVRQVTLGITDPDFDLAPVVPWLKWRDESNR